MSEAAALRRLRREIERIEPRPGRRDGAVPTGFPALDALLPEGGLPRGRVIEWSGPPSSGKASLLRAVLASLRGAGEPVAIVDGGRTLYAPDWAGLRGEEGLFWVIRPPSPADAAWCADLLLRSGAFGAVALDGASGAGTGGRAGRRSGGRPDALRRGVAVRLGRLAEESGALFVAVCEAPVAALRLRFRPGRIEPLRGGPFGPFLPPLRPVWVGVGKGSSAEVPLLCPAPTLRRGDLPARDRKGPR